MSSTRDPELDADRDRGIDPNDPPTDLEELWVAPSTNSARRYHIDESCELLNGNGVTRRVEIAASWFPPCQACVLGGGLNSG